MNIAERNVVTILTIARIVENTLAYCLPTNNPAGFSKEHRERQGKALRALTGKGSPFAVNCANNGDAGKQLAEDMEYFIEDVYGEPGRIVTVDINGHVDVEKSLTIELYSTIVKLRLYLEGFLTSALKYLREHNLLEESFEKTVQSDLRLYHALAGKIGSILIYNKFLEINENANTYMQSYSKSHNGIDPRKDSHFNVDDDPSVRMLKNEFHTLNQDLVNALNTYNDDEDFKFARQSLYSDCEIFTGKKKPTDIKAFQSIFTGYFDKIIRTAEKPTNDLFLALTQDLDAFNKEQAAKKAETKSEATKEEKTNG